MIREEPELGREKSGARCCTCFSVLGRKPAVGVGEAAWDGRGGDGREVCMHVSVYGRTRACCWLLYIRTLCGSQDPGMETEPLEARSVYHSGWRRFLFRA